MQGGAAQGGGDPRGACARPRPSSGAGSAPEPPGRRWAYAPKGGGGIVRSGGVLTQHWARPRCPRQRVRRMPARTPATVLSPDEGGAKAGRPRAATAQAPCLAWEWPRAISAGPARTLPRRPGAMGEDRAVLPGPRDRKGVCPLRFGMEGLRAEAARVWGRERLPAVVGREAVGAPQTVQAGKPVGPHCVVVLLTLPRARQVAGAHIQVPGTFRFGDPNEREGERVLDLSVEHRHSEALELRVRQPAGDELAPMAGPGSEGPPRIKTRPKLSMTILRRPGRGRGSAQPLRHRTAPAGWIRRREGALGGQRHTRCLVRPDAAFGPRAKSAGPRANSAETRVEEAAARPSTNVTAPKSASPRVTLDHTLVSSRRPARGVERMGRP